MIGNYRMASRLILRGAQVDYVNNKGNTALHICIKKKLVEQVKYLLFKNANPHIMNLDQTDSCDMAKENGMAYEILSFNNCNIRKKIVPLLPDGTYPKFPAAYDNLYKK
jgi:ankyrin repeat protein